MVLKRRGLALILSLSLATFLSSGLRAADGPRPAEVLLPLKEYLSLVESAERLDRDRARRQASQEEPLAEVTSQRVRIVLREETADVITDFEVLVQGDPKGPVSLPIAGVPLAVETKTLSTLATAGPATAATPAVTAGAKGGELRLVAPGPGRYAVKVTGQLLTGPGVTRFTLPGAVAPVARDWPVNAFKTSANLSVRLRKTRAVGQKSTPKTRFISRFSFLPASVFPSSNVFSIPPDLASPCPSKFPRQFHVGAALDQG